ncbi:MAG: glutamate racemase [Bacteroidaceae bacterium]|jgi:glutamate racemase|nr:glutamate racemase [Bacteroidaceae bacterium]MBR3373578.1 glutamate racemase [Bacteroidaceae bacterium]MBR3633805.1 glutamate racemase [Bacteroidaceae bacterium]MBR4649420.1 glutamate racemase [Bacteroidaceae bacterium]MDO4950607.1 glutamate racemase [Bacteroidales bacterium]
MTLPQAAGPIGVFDSGYGGLTILRELRAAMPQYDYLYLGDNARAPYGTRSYDIVYRYTLQAVTTLFERGCHLVILACNTASAKALRTIQQNDLPQLDPNRRVLGVIRPTAEEVGSITKSRHVGILATTGTILSHSYDIEIQKLHPDITVTGQDCPMWVPLVENFEFDSPGADYFVEKRINQILEKDPKIDTLILACTHYPLLMDKIRKYTPQGISIISQGQYVAQSLRNYFANHGDMLQHITTGGQLHCLTTENPDKFNATAVRFLGHEVKAEGIMLN